MSFPRENEKHFSVIICHCAIEGGEGEIKGVEGKIEGGVVEIVGGEGI